jgi:hypothetical protein
MNENVRKTQETSMSKPEASVVEVEERPASGAQEKSPSKDHTKRKADQKARAEQLGNDALLNSVMPNDPHPSFRGRVRQRHIVG